MEPVKNPESENQKASQPEKPKSWVEKTEEMIDEAAEKIHKSETYKKVDRSMENATKKLFRSAGKLWGKSEQYFKNNNKKK